MRKDKLWTSRTGKARAAGPSPLLRARRDLESAEAFFAQAIKRRGVVPGKVVTDKHRAYLQAVKRHAPNAEHRRTGFHRKRALTTKPVERSHVAVKGRVRAMRSLGSVPTGQHLLEGIELAQAVQRGDICLADQPELNGFTSARG